MAGITTAGRQAGLTLRQELRIHILRHKQEAEKGRERETFGGGVLRMAGII